MPKARFVAGSRSGSGGGASRVRVAAPAAFREFSEGAVNHQKGTKGMLHSRKILTRLVSSLLAFGRSFNMNEMNRARPL